MQSAQESSTPILIEGANALMLDLDFGTYPYVTSVSLFLVPMRCISFVFATMPYYWRGFASYKVEL